MSTKRDPPKTNDPLKVAQWILSQNDARAPIDMVKFAGVLKDRFGGLDKFAESIRDLYANTKSDQNKMRLLDMVGDIFRRAADQQEAELTAMDLTDQQLAACLRHLVSNGPEEEPTGDTVDRFGT